MPTPYSVKCAECGKELDIVDRTMDGSGDVLCEVDPCKMCMVDAHQAGYRENEEED